MVALDKSRFSEPFWSVASWPFISLYKLHHDHLRGPLWLYRSVNRLFNRIRRILDLPPVNGETLYPFLFNFLLFLGIVGLIFAGYFRGEEALINIALISLSVAVIIRYLEFMFLLIIYAQRPILAFTIAFILAVIILLVVGVPLYLGRRWVFRRMRARPALNGQQA